MNTGSMIYRGDPKIISFLNLVWKCGNANPHYSEQDCIRDVVGVNDDPTTTPVVSEEWSKKFIYVPQWKINAFPKEIECWDKDKRGWQRGDFVIHFAGAWAHVTDDDPTGYLMRKYRSEIVG
jgi:mannan polymerase II complex MNN10 subunit